MNDLIVALRGARNDPPAADYLDQILTAGADEIERLEAEKIAIIGELGRSRELRTKIEGQSMRAMDQLRAQIRGLGAEPLL